MSRNQSDSTLYRMLLNESILQLYIEGIDQVTPEVLEEWINTDADFWGIFQPYYHLLSGRTAFGITDTIDTYASPRKGTLVK